MEKVEEDIESLDNTWLRRILNTPFSTPIESMYTELGVMHIETILMACRVNFFHYLMEVSSTIMGMAPSSETQLGWIWHYSRLRVHI